MTNSWFKPKTHGYGAAPTSWKGWAVTIVYAMVVIAFSVWMVSAPGGRPDAGTVLAWLLMIAAITSAFCLFVKSKTDGDWKWRWGGKE
jgi:hypothetical protein